MINWEIQDHLGTVRDVVSAWTEAQAIAKYAADHGITSRDIGHWRAVQKDNPLVTAISESCIAQIDEIERKHGIEWLAPVCVDDEIANEDSGN